MAKKTLKATLDKYLDHDGLAYLISKLKAQKQACPVPVGAYLEIDVPLATFQANNPQIDWAGTNWQACNDSSVLRATGSTATSGADTVTLTEAQMPKHTHERARYWGSRNDILNLGGVLDSQHLTHLDSSPWHAVAQGTMSEHVGYVLGNNIKVSATGSSASHSNIQKSQGCYRYKRLAA